LRARGAEVRLPHTSAAGDQVQIFLGERLSPGFFAWAIPLGGQRYRIGWGAGASGPQHGLQALRDAHPDFFAGMEVIEQTGGLIPIGPRRRTVGDGGLVIGDAAGHAKATSGGGLYTSLSCAQEGARVAIAALQAGDTSRARLSGYEEAWRVGVGVELERAATLRNIYRRLDDDDLEWGLRLLRLSRVRELVDRDGDIDYPSWLAGSTLRAVPGVRRLFGGDRQAASELGRAAVAAGG
jgi:flavin-dependent dehydrogenase